MKRMVLIAAVLALIAVAAPQASVDERRAAVHLQAAQVKETLEGDLKAAAALYQRAFDEANTNRQIAARALLGLGQAYQKLGTGDARAIFARLVREYADQKEIAATARAHLAGLSATASARRQDGPQRIMSVTSTWISSVSADGRLAAGIDDDGGIVLCDVSAGSTRALVRPAAGEHLFNAVISPDGRLVAYGAIARPSGSPWPVALRVIGVESNASPRTVWAQPSGQTILPVAWSTDGKEVLTRRGTGAAPGVPRASLTGFEMAWVSLTTGEFRAVRRFERWQNPQGTTVSPDGQWIAYADVPEPDPQGTNIHIYVTPAQGGTANPVVKMAGRNVAPVWTADSSRLLFTSDRSGQGLWSVAVQAGAAVGDPVQIQAGFNDRIVGRSASDVLYLARSRPGSPTVLVADHSASGVVVRYSFPGSNASISPNGGSVAFFSSKTNPTSTQLTVRHLESGEERRYAREFYSPGQGLPAPQWFPTGDALLVYAPPSGDDGPGGAFFRVDVATGAFSRLFPRDSQDYVRSVTGRLSHDGLTFYTLARTGKSGNWTQLVGVDVMTGSERGIATLPGEGLAAPVTAGLAVSPDGKSLAIQVVAAVERRPRATLFVLDLGNGAARQLHQPFLAGGYSPMLPAWSPDGQRVLVGQREDQSSWRVVSVPVNATSDPALVFDLSRLQTAIALPGIRPDSGGGITVSRDGSRMAFVATSVSTTELWASPLITSVADGNR